MPKLVDSTSRMAALIAAINQILATSGPSGLTMREIARVSRVSTSSILNHLTSKERLVRVTAHRTAEEKRVRFLVEQQDRGLLALLPKSDDSLIAERSWLAWLEMWRCEPTLRHVFEDHIEQMRAVLSELTGHRLSPTELTSLLAMVDGLRHAVCAPDLPLPRHQAESILTAHLRGFGIPGNPPGAGEGRAPSPLVQVMLGSAARRGHRAFV